MACGRHAGLPLVENELEILAAELRTLQTDRLVVSWVEPPKTPAEAIEIRDRLVAAAERAAALGLRLGFHNHDGELTVLDDGRSLLDRLIDDADSPLFLELDLGWVWYAGFEPLSLLERAGPRAPLVHVKDMRNDGGPVYVPLGDGDVDYRRLDETSVRAGTEWLILEQDETYGAGFDAVAESIGELHRLLGVSA